MQPGLKSRLQAALWYFKAEVCFARAPPGPCCLPLAWVALLQALLLPKPAARHQRDYSAVFRSGAPQPVMRRARKAAS